MKHLVLALLVLCVMVCVPAQAGAMAVAEGLITTQISDRLPVDAVQSYPAASGRLFCFTHIVGAAEGTRVFHVWYRGEQEMARIELSVRSADWRTWSSKSLLPGWAGDWRVEVIDDEGVLLQTIPFTLL
ncbi:DUF2914 domain-containing protein [Trichloromonas sp.]|uniref:DUF2914 domain-containing protein n=1 Tax=Trichloromonas sp. TaxID=3069249 RepID=UPI003D816765